ncbi:MAG: hypothetical protein LIO62_00790 [Clostridiales bacterium]|nr:hypothetical protein [Clostridiales bacterium]
MREFRKKQKRLFSVMKILVIVSAVLIFIYIGVQPYVAELSNVAAVVCSYICDLLVIVDMVIIFSYYSKYGKSDSFLTQIEHEISDAGYYFTSHSENSADDYIISICDDLKSCRYSIDKNITVDDFDFAVRAYTKKEMFYIADINDLDKNDVLAYIDTVITDVTVHKIRRKGDVVICFITDKADDGAVSLSKMITPIGKKEQLKIAISIVELSSDRVYFLGNMPTKCQQMIVNHVMNCDLPLDEKYIGKERLQFQDELEERMKDFNIKDFKDGNFYAH